LAFGWSRECSPQQQGRVNPVDPSLGFLGLAPFGRENPDFEGWKGLDFLGFSRLNRALSMGYDGFSLNEISRALLPPRQNRGNGSPNFGLPERDGLVMGKT
jgi:hypothetical protein